MAMGTGPLAVAPGNMLDDHPMIGAVDSPGGVKKPRHNPPQRRKEKPALGQSVITRGRPQAARTSTPDALVRLHRDLETTRLAVPMALKPDVAINKSGKMLNGVQNGLNLQLHGWSAAPCSIDLQQRLISPRPAFFNPLPPEIFALPYRCGLEDKALQECNLSAEPPWIAMSASHPVRVKVSDRTPVLGMSLQATAKAKNSSLFRPSGRCFSCGITHKSCY